MLTAIRRSLVALGVAGAVAIYMKLQGGEETPAHEGGWRELSGPDLS